MGNIIEFIKKNKWFFLAGVVIVALVLIFSLRRAPEVVPPTLPLTPAEAPTEVPRLTPSGFEELARRTEIEEGKPLGKPKLSLEPEIGSFSTSELKFDFFVPEENVLKKKDLTTGLTEVSYKPWTEIQTTDWSPQEDKIILQDQEGFQFLDISTGYKKRLPKNITNYVWSPDGSKIAYQYFDPQTKSSYISIANPDGTEWENLVEVKSEGPTEIIWITEWDPEGNWVYFTPEITDVSGGRYKRINLKTKEIEDLSDWGSIAGLKCSPDGSKILYATLDRMVPNLRVMNADGSNRQDTGQDTFVANCIFRDSRYVICALPEKFYNPEASEILVELDIETLEIRQLTPLEPKIHTSDLELSPDGKTLYFINTLDRKLHSLSL